MIINPFCRGVGRLGWPRRKLSSSAVLSQFERESDKKDQRKKILRTWTPRPLHKSHTILDSSRSLSSCQPKVLPPQQLPTSFYQTINFLHSSASEENSATKKEAKVPPPPVLWIDHVKECIALGNCVSMDVEFVDSIYGTIIASMVGICGQDGPGSTNIKVLYKAMIYREYGSYTTNERITGVTNVDDKTLTDKDKCTELEIVQEKVKELLQNKLVIVCSGRDLKSYLDFTALELDSDDFDVFNIQQHWNKGRITSKKKLSYDPISLKTIVNYYYPTSNFQAGVHSPEEDAMFALKVFLDHYVSTKKNTFDSRVTPKQNQFNDMFLTKKPKSLVNSIQNTNLDK